MKTFLQVGASNAINRYGDRFSVGALTRSVHYECLGGIPILVAHDSSRLIGWSWPLAVHLAPGLARSVSLMGVPLSEEDKKQVARRFDHHLYKTGIQNFETEIDDLRDKLSPCLLGKEKAIVVECAALIETGLATRMFPEFFSGLDKDGLIPLEKLTPIAPGLYQVKEFVLFAHSFFRRSLYPLNTLNSPFLEQLHLLDTKKLSVKLALDPDMVGLASTYRGGRMELAYWWGPEFDNDLAKIPAGVSVFEEDDKTKRSLSGISRTEFRWGSRKGEHIFEAEELRDIPLPSNQNKYGCRFVHSIVKETSGEIIHFDGSIRVYSEDKMIERLELDLAAAGRDTEYKKLWRCDGVVEVAPWKRLLSDYFRDNYLVGMYLGATNPFDEPHLELPGISSREELVPYSMTPGIGIRVAVSYQASTNKKPPYIERSILPMDSISDGSETRQYIESYGIELRKILHRLGASLDIPENMQIVTFRDLYANLPLIYHHRDHLSDSLHQTVKAIKLLVESWREKDIDIVLSFKLGFPINEEVDVYLSFLGHVADIATWLSHPLSFPPTSLEDLHEWAEDVSEYLSNCCPIESFDTPPLLETLMPSGVLFIDRQPIPNDWKVQYHNQCEGLVYKMIIPENQHLLAKQILAEDIVPAIAMQVLASRCTKCDQSYLECACSKSLDDNVAQEITDARLLRMFWTDRPI
jgi:hypothetical protein